MKSLLYYLSIALLFSSMLAAEDLKQGDGGKYLLYYGNNEPGQASFEVSKADRQGIEIKSTNKLTYSNGAQMSIESTTLTAPCGKLKSYSAVVDFRNQAGEVQQQGVKVVFESNKAMMTIQTGDNKREHSIDLPEEYLIFDNNNMAHFILFVKKLSPDQKPVSGKIFVPQSRQVVDYTVEYLGAAERNIRETQFHCDKYNLSIGGGMLEMPLYVSEGKLLAVGNDGAELRIELVIE